MPKVAACPICGSCPEISSVGKEKRKEYKLSCSKSALHISCGDWFPSIKAAKEDWNRRTTGYGQPEFYHPTYLEILKAELRTTENGHDFVDILKHEISDLDLDLEEMKNNTYKEKFANILDSRVKYPCCDGCNQYGQRYCICKYVRYGEYKKEGYED